MTTFLVLAALLIVVGVAAVAVPLLKSAPPNGPAPAPWAAMGAAGLLVIGSAILYVTWSNWSWRATAPAADSPRTMVARLARKLEQNPDDLKGWLMLGQSYAVLEEYPLALRAYQRADRLAGGKSADALVGEAESLVLSDASEIDGRAGKLVEQALAIDPSSGKALFYGAAAAERRGDLPTARDRFSRLLALNPPANVRPVIEQQIAAIDQQMGKAPSQPQAPAPTPNSSSSAVAASGSASTSSPAVRVKVTLAPSLASSASGSSPLFVFVRDPAQPGPPLAVKRLSSHFPQTVELTTQDSMVPGRMFSAGQKVQVVARIARSGNPLAGRGDPFGETPYLVGRDGLVNVVIDRLTP
jgi:cytochrome c-type biogenesis protein CcmH